MTKPISQVIKEKKEHLGISIEEISEKTFIPPKFLRYIEEEKWNKFPSQTHLKGFLKNYLAFLDIPTEILSQYPEIFSEPAGSQTDLPAGKQVQDEPKKLYNASKAKKIVLAVIALFIVIDCLIFFINIFKLESIVRQTKSIKKTAIVSHLYNITANIKSSKTMSFSLEATENVWILAENNGKIILEKTLRKGEKKELKGGKVFLRMGNAGGLLIIHNGKRFGPFGKKGEVKNIIIDKNFFSK